ncbi:MAG: hypothetical protein WC322_04930 [Candidatus Paceibacterota bacterium]|jgi:Ran GTPase-activating protein (RanGAP) involved in mRNA processing and transport
MLTFKHEETLKALQVLNTMANTISELAEGIAQLQALFDTSLTPDVKKMRVQVDELMGQISDEQCRKLQDMFPAGVPDTELENVIGMLLRTIDKNNMKKLKGEFDANGTGQKELSGNAGPGAENQG